MTKREQTPTGDRIVNTITPAAARTILHRIENDHHAQMLANALEGLLLSRGASTPAENFLESVLVAYSCKNLDPEQVHLRLEEFHQNQDLLHWLREEYIPRLDQ